jgi:hypothetical protein
MLHIMLGRYDRKMKTRLRMMSIPPNVEKGNKCIGSKSFRKHNSIYDPIGSQYLMPGDLNWSENIFCPSWLFTYGMMSSECTGGQRTNTGWLMPGDTCSKTGSE